VRPLPGESYDEYRARHDARFDWIFALVISAGVILAAIALGGCATGATNARKVVTGAYTAIGAAAVLARPALKACEDKAVDDKSDAELQKCAAAQQVLAKALPAAESTAAAVSASIDAYEKIAAKDYGGALAPLYGALVELAQALTTAGVKLPVQIPGVN
jgi:hypothetical protein